MCQIESSPTLARSSRAAPCAATIAARFSPEALSKATLFFGAFNRQEFQQVDTEVGGPLSGNTSHQARHSPPADRRWDASEKLLEYRTSSQVLPIMRSCRVPRQPPFCTNLADKACNPMYKARRRPYAQSGKETLSMYSFLLIFMIMCIRICMLI